MRFDRAKAMPHPGDVLAQAYRSDGVQASSAYISAADRPREYEWSGRRTSPMMIDAVVTGRSQLVVAVLAMAALGTPTEVARGVHHATSPTPHRTATSDEIPSLISAWSTPQATIIVGDDGTVLVQTTGATWSRRGVPFTGRLRAVWGTDQTFFTAGDHGAILRSRDGGETWQRVHLDDEYATFWSVTGTSANDIYAVGSRGLADEALVLETHDGGATWSRRIDEEPSEMFSNGETLFRINDNALERAVDSRWEGIATPFDPWSGWARGQQIVVGGASGAIAVTADGGATWTTASCIADEYREALTAFTAIGDTLYATGGRGFVCASTDGGASWKVDFAGSRRHAHYAISARGAVVTVTGEDGLILRRESNRWFAQSEPATIALTGVWGVTRRVAVAVGRGGAIIRTIDGTNWKRVSSPTSHDLYRIWGIGQDLYVGGDEGVMLVSHDGGESFRERSVGTTMPITGVWGDDLMRHVFVASAGGIFRSDDHGDTWEHLPAPEANYQGVFALSWVFLYAAAGESVVSSGDAGKTWDVVDTELDTWLVKIWGAYGVLYAIGTDGHCVTSRDGGASWLPVFHAMVDVNDIWGASAREVFVVGDVGMVAQVPTRSPTWTDPGVRTRLNAIWGFDGANLIVVGDHGMIMRTRDAGASWERQVVR
jgi:photosystem II stability/assembly factor-like uncharacterized protein